MSIPNYGSPCPIPPEEFDIYFPRGESGQSTTAVANGMIPNGSNPTLGQDPFPILLQSINPTVFNQDIDKMVATYLSRNDLEDLINNPLNLDPIDPIPPTWQQTNPLGFDSGQIDPYLNVSPNPVATSELNYTEHLNYGYYSTSPVNLGQTQAMPWETHSYGPIEIGTGSEESMEQVNPTSVYERDWTVRDPDTGKLRPPLLHEYLRQLLDDNNFGHVARYLNRNEGIFKFTDKDEAARLWQKAKSRNCDSEMTYEKFSRAIRHYYEKGIMRRCPGRFTFRFGPESGFRRSWHATS